jgi:hypothetical protein
MHIQALHALQPVLSTGLVRTKLNSDALGGFECGRRDVA